MSGIIINVETRTSDRALKLGPDPKEIQAPVNWVDSKKIKERVDENRAKWNNHLPLDPRTCEVAGVGIAGHYAMGWRAFVGIVAPEDTFLKGMGPLVMHTDTHLEKAGLELLVVIRHPTEFDLLRWTWEQLADLRARAGTEANASVGSGVIMGFGIREFGLPVLMLRSIYREVPNIGITFDQLSKYRSWTETGVLDLQEYLRAVRATDRFTLTGWSLKRYAKYFELPARPHGDPDEFPLYYGADNFAFCCKHIGHALLTLRALIERIGSTLVA